MSSSQASVQTGTQTGTTIKPKPNGPLLIDGEYTITGPEGTELAKGPAPVALCRCGHSDKKPFCDGSHGRVGFQS